MRGLEANHQPTDPSTTTNASTRIRAETNLLKMDSITHSFKAAKSANHGVWFIVHFSNSHRCGETVLIATPNRKVTCPTRSSGSLDAFGNHRDSPSKSTAKENDANSSPITLVSSDNKRMTDSRHLFAGRIHGTVASAVAISPLPIFAWQLTHFTDFSLQKEVREMLERFCQSR